MYNEYYIAYCVRHLSGRTAVYKRVVMFYSDDVAIESCRKLEHMYGNQLKSIRLEKIESAGLPIYRKIY